jgi:hypothetical protein
VAATVQLILEQGASFDFSTVVALTDPSSSTIASFLDMFQLERLLFIKLFSKLSPLKCAEAEAAHKRADRLAAIALQVETMQNIEQTRSSRDLALVSDFEQRRVMWEASPAQRPQDTTEYDWRLLQKQLNPTYKKKDNASQSRNLHGPTVNKRTVRLPQILQQLPVSTHPLLRILPSLETHPVSMVCICSTNQHAAVVFAVHKHNERDNFMRP